MAQKVHEIAGKRSLLATKLRIIDNSSTVFSLIEKKNPTDCEARVFITNISEYGLVIQ